MKDWHSLPFEECIEKIVYTAKVQRKDFLTEGAYPVVSQEEAFINGFWDNEVDIFRVDRPVVVFGDHTRVIKYVDFDFALGADGVKVLKPKSFLYPKFFYYQLHTAKLNSLGYARHYRLLKEHHVVYPAYSEQQRIAAILDEAFDGIAIAKANAQKNLLAAQELFDSFSRGIFGEISSVFLSKRVDQISDNLDCKRVPVAKSERKEGGYPYYGASGIVDYIDDYIFEGDCLLVSEDGANLLARSTPIAFSVAGRYWVNNHAHVLKFDHMATQKFVEYYLESISLDEYITGAAQPKLNQKALNSISIPIPDSIDEQIEIVGRLEGMAKRIEQIKAIWLQKSAALDELKKSLLHQAFTGQL